MGKSSRVATTLGASSSGDVFCKDLPKFRVISISIFFFSSVHELFLEKEDEELGERRRGERESRSKSEPRSTFSGEGCAWEHLFFTAGPLKRQLTSQLNTTTVWYFLTTTFNFPVLQYRALTVSITPIMSTGKRPDGSGTREYKYSTEISQMMFVVGEVQEPMAETVNLVEDIVRSQIIELVREPLCQTGNRLIPL